MEKKKYMVHLAAYYTADVLVEATSKEEAIQLAEEIDDVDFEYMCKMESDCWLADEKEIEVYLRQL